MSRLKAWFLIGLVSASCIVPDVEVVDDDDDTPGSSGKSSSPSAGKANSPAAGSPAEDGGSPGASAGPSVGGTQGGGSGAEAGTGTGPTPPAKVAFGKFCNGLSFDLTLTLRIGTGAKAVEISAAADECTPISGEACTPMPVGINVPLTLLNGDDPIITYPVDIAEGVYWIFLAYENGETIDVAGDPVTQDICELGYDAPTPGGA